MYPAALHKTSTQTIEPLQTLTGELSRRNQLYSANLQKLGPQSEIYNMFARNNPWFALYPVFFEKIYYAFVEKPDKLFWTRLKEKNFAFAGKWL